MRMDHQTFEIRFHFAGKLRVWDCRNEPRTYNSKSFYLKKRSFSFKPANWIYLKSCDGGICSEMSSELTNRRTGYSSRAEERVPLEVPEHESMYEGITYANGKRMYENTYLNGVFEYPPLLKWKYVPEDVKQEMKEIVHSYISKQYEGGIPNQVLHVPFYAYTVYDKKKGWCGSRKEKYLVLIKHAILEYMKEKKMTDKPFTLLGENYPTRGWTIQYVYMPETH